MKTIKHYIYLIPILIVGFLCYCLADDEDLNDYWI